MSIRPWRDIHRRQSRQIMVGNVPVGGGAPVSVQSMTTTLTSDVNATLQQIAELTAAGCDIGRVACPTDKDADALPIIALAPLLNNMFDSTSSLPRRVVAGIIVFFPVFINTLRGLREVNPIHQELMHTYAASGWTFAVKVRLPGSLPHVFTGLRQASSLAVIAAVVAEYFGGLQTGLGSRITSAAAFTAYPRAWAFVVGACLLGLVFYLTTLLLERLAMPWRTRLIA